MKKIRRRPDGTPEYRSLDDMLRAAVDDETYKNLPGKGKPLDLSGYFAPGAENRAATRILKDNGILPQHLQERKEAEDHQRRAAALVEQAVADLAPIREDVAEIARAAVAPFPDRQSCQACFGWSAWPDSYPFPAGAEVSPAVHRDAVESLARHIMRYNARVRNLIYRYMEALRKAQENLEALQKRQMLSRTLVPTYDHTALIDLDAKAREIGQKFPYLPEMASDRAARLKAWRKKQQPSLWTRLKSRGA